MSNAKHLAHQGIAFDEQRWPIVVMTFYDDSTEDDWKDAVDRVCSYAARQERFAMIADGTHLTKMPSARTRKIGASLNERIVQTPDGQNLVAWANVINSPIVRGLVTAILWLSPKVSFQQVQVSTVREGIGWAERVLSGDAVR